MDLKTILFLLADLALIVSGYYYGWKFLRKRNVLLGFEWWIIAISASNFFVYGLTGAKFCYDTSMLLDAFSRGFGFPVIGIAGAAMVTHHYKPSALTDALLFAVSFASAFVLMHVDAVAPYKAWFYIAMGVPFALFLVYFSMRLWRVGERGNALNLLLVNATSMAIAVIYDFFSIPGDDADHTIFYILALSTWSYLLVGFYYAYCSLERAEKS